jgi:hypothetical protein
MILFCRVFFTRTGATSLENALIVQKIHFCWQELLREGIFAGISQSGCFGPIWAQKPEAKAQKATGSGKMAWFGS